MIDRVFGIIAVVFSCALTALAHPVHNTALQPWQTATAWPDRIIVSPGSDPQTSLTVDLADGCNRRLSHRGTGQGKWGFAL